MANSLRSRPAKASYSCHSRSVTWLTALRLRTLAPLASRKAASYVPGAQPARVHLDGQLLQLGRPAGQTGAHPGDERLGAIGHLRHAVVDGALRGAQPSAPVAVAIAGARDGAAFVVPAAHGLGHLGFQRFLDDLPDRELDQFAPRVALSDALRQQLRELLACPLRGRYSRLHGDASSCRRRQPASLGFRSKQECIPVSLSSNIRTSPSAVPISFLTGTGRRSKVERMEMETASN